MVALILFIVFGLLFGYFATLNTGLVSVHFGTYNMDNIPMYLLVLASLGIGIVFASIFYSIKFLSYRLSAGRKNRELSESKKEINELTKEVHRLELENTKMKAQTGEEVVDEDSI